MQLRKPAPSGTKGPATMSVPLQAQPTRIDVPITVVDTAFATFSPPDPDRHRHPEYEARPPRELGWDDLEPIAGPVSVVRRGYWRTSDGAEWLERDSVSVAEGLLLGWSWSVAQRIATGQDLLGGPQMGTSRAASWEPIAPGATRRAIERARTEAWRRTPAGKRAAARRAIPGTAHGVGVDELLASRSILLRDGRLVLGIGPGDGRTVWDAAARDAFDRLSELLIGRLSGQPVMCAEEGCGREALYVLAPRYPVCAEHRQLVVIEEQAPGMVSVEEAGWWVAPGIVEAAA